MVEELGGVFKVVVIGMFFVGFDSGVLGVVGIHRQTHSVDQVVVDTASVSCLFQSQIVPS